MVYTHYASGIVVLYILTLAALLGLVSGVFAVRLAMSGTGSMTIKASMFIILMAALLSWLIAAHPGAWAYTLGVWVMAAWGMAMVDLTVALLLGPRRPSGKLSTRSRSRIGIGLALSTALLIAAIVVGFDLIEEIAERPLAVMGAALAIASILAILDVIMRLALHLSKRRKSILL